MQAHLWIYYTRERPPLWIIPAWPIASLSIDRLTRLLNHLLQRINLQPLTSNLQSPIPNPQPPVSRRVIPNHNRAHIPSTGPSSPRSTR